MNAEWVLALADAMTSGSIILAGPQQDPDPRLIAHPRIKAIGSLPISELLAEGCADAELIIDVTIETDGAASVVRTGRTPEDVPIVGVVARRSGEITRFALCGVAESVVLLDAAGLDGLAPLADHRASASYRRHLAEVLTARALEELS